AGEYWLLKKTFGWSITEQRWSVVRVILLTVNALPFLIYLVLLARIAEQIGTTDWGKIYIVAAGCFATFLTTFVTTLNNHTVAACTAIFALYPGLSVVSSPLSFAIKHAWRFALAGFFAGLTAAIELPAAAFLAGLLVLLSLRDPRRTLAFFAPAAAVPIAAWFLTNYLAIARWTPAYGEFGGPWYEYAGSHWIVKPGEVKHGIDWAAHYESRWAYAFHFLL